MLNEKGRPSRRPFYLGQGRGLDEPCFLQRDEGATLLHRLEAASGYAYGDLLADLRNEKSLLLEIDLAAALARRIVFGRTRSIGIAPADLGVLTGYFAYACHTSGNSTV